MDKKRRYVSRKKRDEKDLTCQPYVSPGQILLGEVSLRKLFTYRNCGKKLDRSNRSERRLHCIQTRIRCST